MTDSRRHSVLAAIPLAGTLCATAGAVDVIAYILFGKVFIANMTGNTVLFAASVVLHDWKQAALRIGIVLAFLAGISFAHAVLRRITARRERRREVITLVIELCVVSWLALMPHPDLLRTALLVVLAFAMGMQNNAFRQIGPVKLSTVYISGDLENLGEAIADSEQPGKGTEARLKTAVFVSTWVAYAVGALLGAEGALHFGEKALLLPDALVVAAILVLMSSVQKQA